VSKEEKKIVRRINRRNNKKFLHLGPEFCEDNIPVEINKCWQPQKYKAPIPLYRFLYKNVGNNWEDIVNSLKRRAKLFNNELFKQQLNDLSSYVIFREDAIHKEQMFYVDDSGKLQHIKRHYI
jgi:hypothetical protein